MRSCWKRRGCCESWPFAVRRSPRRRGHGQRPTANGGRAMIVIKFGGTSVGDAQRVANAIDIVAERRHLRPIVVVSALAGVTNDLVAASEAAKRCEIERVDEIIARIRQRHEDVAVQL